MSAVKARFEKELKQKLAQKATARLTEESILLKNFKYFDLDNSGAVDRDEFAKAIEKAGIQFLNKQELEDIFNIYDSNKSGDIDYHEFVSNVFGVEINRPGTAQSQPSKNEGSEADVEKFRRKLKERGGTGILGLGRQFRIFDDNNSRTLDISEFKKAVRDFQVDIADGDIQKVFNFFDRDRDGSLNYDEFLLGVRGPINNYRKKLVEQAFAKFDKDGSGSVTIDDLKGLYNAKFHPDVKAGKKTEDQVLKEFLNTFEAYSDLHGVDAEITKEEFVDYYTFISASIDNDEYFELMINNAWRINEGANKNWDKKGWADTTGAGDLQKSYQKKQESAKKGGIPQTSAQKQQGSAQKPPAQGGASFGSTIEKIRAKLATRGARGFIGIQRQFKIMDDNNDKAISYQEFAKAIRDYKCELSEDELNAVFQEVDRDGNGSLSIDELVRAIQGEMNGFRRGIVNTVFNKLDKDGDGVIRVNDIKGVYNAKNHPDVKSGKRTEDDLLGEFLETFEMHHNLKGGLKDQNVTREEFIEYYNNISANVDNDQYFETLLVNAFKLYETMPQYQQYALAGGRKDIDPKGWSQDYSSQFKSKTTSNAPYGTSNAPTDYSTNLRPKTGQSSAQKEESVKRAAGAATNFSQIQQKISSGEAAKNSSTEELISKFRGKLLARGVRGIFSIGRLFRNMDDDNSKSISFPEFSKVCNEFRMDLPVSDVRLLFNFIDVNRNGEIDYDEFLRMVRGTMNDARKKWVGLAFKKLDKDGSGVVNLDDLRGVYNATKHPDVISGKKTEDEILGEFLDTFEIHHANLTGDPKCRDKTVTFEEFTEYYNNISCSIDDDAYFELMIKNAWNFDNVTYQKGWAAEVSKK